MRAMSSSTQTLKESTSNLKRWKAQYRAWLNNSPKTIQKTLQKMTANHYPFQRPPSLSPLYNQPPPPPIECIICFQQILAPIDREYQSGECLTCQNALNVAGLAEQISPAGPLAPLGAAVVTRCAICGGNLDLIPTAAWLSEICASCYFIANPAKHPLPSERK